MKFLPIFSIVAGLLLSLIPGAHAHWGDQVYPIIELTDSDLARIDLQDGDIGDWEEIIGAPTLTALDFDLIRGQYDPSSFNSRLWLGWHDASNRLYVAMEQVDDFYVNEYDRNGFADATFITTLHDGSIRLSVDGDHSGGTYTYASSDFDTDEEWAFSTDQEAQGYAVIGEVFDSGTHIGTTATEILSQNGLEAVFEDWFVQPPYAAGGGGSQGEQPSVAVTEFYVTPFDRLIWNSLEESVISDLFPGKTIGLSIRFADMDEPLIMESIYSLPGSGSRSAFTANGFADFVLVGTDGSIPQDTAVESGTWARIKASFR
ncbi:MAG: hypothetical protein HOC74_14595 [Gemmatimonadetes bacterium]|jgi:hypothetical protein|nr:hypothetical protein [Gemmatimonadota bacterium]